MNYCKKDTTLILKEKDYHDLVEKIKRTGDEVVNTYELCGETCLVLGTPEDIKRIFKIDDKFERDFMQAISTFEKKKIGPYITEKYFHIIPAIKKAFYHMTDDCFKTRRFVVDFPEGHCFRSVQFLLRDNTINVVCYMRSCDAIRNLPTDIWLCSKMAEIVSHLMHRILGLNPCKYHKIKMMFGSLHVYNSKVYNEDME